MVWFYYFRLHFGLWFSPAQFQSWLFLVFGFIYKKCIG